MRPLVLIAAGLFVLFGVPDVSQFSDWLPVPVVKPVEVDRVVLVYEKDEWAVPAGVRSALNKLNREHGVEATLFEIDNKNANDQVPKGYESVVAASKSHRLPFIAVMNGMTVLKIVEGPGTEDQILEATLR
jgi:hypothetical protein